MSRAVPLCPYSNDSQIRPQLRRQQAGRRPIELRPDDDSYLRASCCGATLSVGGESHYHSIPSSRSVDGGQVDSRACAAHADVANSAGRSVTPLTECLSLVIGYRDLVGLPVGDCKGARRKILADHSPVLRERRQVAVERGARGVDRFHRDGGIAWWGRVGVCVDCRNRRVSCNGYRAIPVGWARVQPVVKEVITTILYANRVACGGV